MVHRPAVQVNRFSWSNNANTDKHLDGKRREFINSRKYSNSSPLFPPQQASLVSQERLQAVVHKVAGSNRFKGKRQQILVIKEQQTNEYKVFNSSQLIWNQATLSSEFATLYCNKLHTLVYLLSEWSFSGIMIYDKYHRQFLFGLTLVCKAILLNQCFLLHSYVNWEELRPLVTYRAYGIKEGFNPCVIQKQFMHWYALVSLSPLSLLSLTILLCYFYYCCFYYYCYYFIVTDLYKTITSLTPSLLLSLYIYLLFSLLLWCNPAHTVILAYYCGLYGAGVMSI